MGAELVGKKGMYNLTLESWMQYGYQRNGKVTASTGTELRGLSS
jgi:hypothetical protein